MTKTPDIESAAIRKANVLSVGPTDPNDDCLERIFHASDWSAYTNSEWTLITTPHSRVGIFGSWNTINPNRTL
jgi:hypothetical protein